MCPDIRYGILIIVLFEHFSGMKIYRSPDFILFIIINSLVFDSVYLVLDLLISKYIKRIMISYIIASIFSPIFCIGGLMIKAYS